MVWAERALLGLFVIFAGIAWTYIITAPRRKKQAGALLWNLGWPSEHKMMLLTGTILFILAIVPTTQFFYLAKIGDEKLTYYFYLAISYWSTVIYFFWAGLSKLELRENGIYFKFGLIKWQEIALYKWKGKKGNTLTVWLKNRIPFCSKRSWQIPLDHKETMDTILNQYLSRTFKLRNAKFKEDSMTESVDLENYDKK